MMNKGLYVFGEVLFDVFPDGNKVLGGAPFNVAWHLQAFSQSPFFISRIGNDVEGEQIRKAMLGWGMDTYALQTDEKLSTGKVIIRIQDGEPEYEIIEPVAYDAIDLLPENVPTCDFLYHGSLAVRNETSYQSLKVIKNHQPKNIFVDVNLRDPWWDKSVVLELLHQASWVKFNTNEFDILYASGKAADNVLSSFIDEYGLQGVILTHGKAGAEVMTADKQQYMIEPDVDIEVVDTVGAGDAFSSVMILGIRNGWPMQKTLERAQNFASMIVGQRGATVSDPGFYQDIMNEWQINQ
jgi:fructokinase